MNTTDMLMKSFDLEQVRAQFPILQREVHGHPLCYLDNGATTQKPQSVIDSLCDYYQHSNANVHRGTHCLSQEATELYEGARENIRSYLNASSTQEIIYTSGVTNGINLLAHSLSHDWKAGDEVIVTGMEHHSNIVPWQFLRDSHGVVLKVLEVNPQGEIDIQELERLITPRTKLVAVVHVSNALGTVNPVKQIIDMAHQRGALALVDGAQSIGHMPIDVQALDCDFYAISSHKMFGPTGFGVLYGKQHLLEAMRPFQGGGDMIIRVSFDSTEFNELPYKFEAGTPHIAGAVGFGAAIDFMRGIDFDKSLAHEVELLQQLQRGLRAMPKVTLIGEATHQAAVQSFHVDGVHPLDLTTMLDQDGVALRAGHHCAMPVMEKLGYSGSSRASMALYNTAAEIEQCLASIEANIDILSS